MANPKTEKRLTVETVSATVVAVGISTIKVSDGTLTDNGDGSVTITTGGGGGGAVGPADAVQFTDGAGNFVGSADLTFDDTAKELYVNGKLTVTGLIDPTGLELTAQAANPGGTPALTIWSDSGSANRLTYGSAQILLDTDKGVANGVASLDGAGKVPTAQLPSSVIGGLNYQGTWNANTNTPTLTSGVGVKGYYYVVSVAGTTTLDGVSDWEIGDWAVFNGTAWEKVDNTDSVTSVFGRTGAVSAQAGDYSASQVTGALDSANNLSDVANAATSRANLGLAIGSDVQAYNATLEALATTTLAANQMPFYTSGTTAGTTTITAFARTLIDDATAADARTTLGGVITATTTDTLQNKTILAADNTLDATLEDVAGLTPSSGEFIVGDGSNFTTESGATARTSLGAAASGLATSSGLTSTGTKLIGRHTASTGALEEITLGSNLSFAGSTLNVSGLGTGTVTSVALTAPSDFTVTGSPITTSGTLALAYTTQTANEVFAGPATGAAATPGFRVLVTDDIPTLPFTKITGTLGISQGGTGATTASGARTNLGLAIGSDVQAYNANLADISGMTPTLDNFIVGDGSNFTLETPANARTSLGLGTAALDDTTDFLQVANNLSDLASASTARTNLGLGTMATQNANNVSITGGTIADITAFNLTDATYDLIFNLPTLSADATITFPSTTSTLATTADIAGFITASSVDTLTNKTISGSNNTLSNIAASSLSSSNLQTLAGLSTTADNFIVGNSGGTDFELKTPAQARTSLGLGTAALNATTDFLQVSNNLSDLASASTARTNLGLGTAAVLDTGTTSGDVPLINGSNKIEATLLTEVIDVNDLADVTITSPATNDTIIYNGTSWVNGTTGGGGTVTSVALTMPTDVFDISGSPITGSGTLAVTFDTQLANKVFAGPSTGAATTPTFRDLVAADIPDLSSVYQPLDSNLTDISGLGTTADNFLAGNGTNIVLKTPAQARTSLGLGSAALNNTGDFLQVANNLSDLNNVTTAQQNLSLEPGVDVQAYSVYLLDIAGLARTDGNIIVGNGTTWVAESGATARASLGLTIGTDVQAYNANLADISGLATTDSSFIVGDGANFVLEGPATARTSLGLGTAATKDTGTSSGQVPLINGSGKIETTLLTNTIGLGDLTNVTISTPTAGQVLQWSGTQWVNSAEDGPLAGSIATNQVAYGSAANTIGGDNDFTWDGTALLLDSESPIRFGDGAGTEYVGFQAPTTITASQDYVLPTNYPASNGYVLSSTTTGTLSWVDSGTGFTWNVDADSGGPLAITDGDTLDIAGGTGLTTAISGSTLTATLDLSELTTSTSDADGDFFAVVDAANAQKKLTKANINLSGFNNDSGFITGISIGSAIGSGTTGSILFVDASNQLGQDNANLFWDDTNNRLGLGTTSPAYSLEVESADNILARFESTDANASIQLVDSSTTNATAFTRTANNMNILPNGGNLGVAAINSYAGVAPTDGQLLIGDTASGLFDAATLTGGTGITITNGAGAITVAADNNGTVTSVGTANSTFISGSGGPITTSGSLTYSLSATGTPSSSTFLRGDNTWAAIPGGFTSWDLAGDSGSAQTITDGNTATFAGGTGISTSAGATDTLTITNTGVTSNVAGTGISVSGATGAVTITNTGVTSAVGGTGVDVSGATGAVTFSLDLNELTTSTSDADGDFFAVIDSVGAQKKLTKANINLSGFNNDSGFTTNTGTVTSVSTSNSTFISGSGGPITGSGSLTYSLSATGTPSSSTFLRGDNTWATPAGGFSNFDISDGTTTQTINSGDTVTFADGTFINQVVSATDTVTADLSATGTPSSSTYLRGDNTWAAIAGDIEGVTAGTGLSGGGTSGTVTLNIDYAGTDNFILAATTDTTLIGADSMVFSDSADSDTVKDIVISNIPLSAFNNDSGWTSNTGDITGVTAGTLLDGGGTSGTVTLDVDLSELATSTSDADGDFFAVIDAANAQKKLTKANINLSGFNNDSGFTTNTGTVTSVGTSNSTFISGSGGPITGSGSLAYSLSATGTPSSSTYLRGDNTWATIAGDIEGVTAGTGLSGGGTSGTVTLNIDYAGTDNFIRAATIDTTLASGDYMVFSDTADSNTVKEILVSNIPLGQFNNDQGWTSNAGDITGVTAGTGLSGGGTSGTVTVNFDGNSLSASGTLVGTDDLVVVDGTTSAKTQISTIPLSIFNNDAGWTSNSGTVTSVGTANSTFISGSGGPITGSGSLTYSLSATGTPSSSTYLRGDNTWATIAGDIEGVTAGTGLSGGGTSGTVTLNIDYAGTDNYILVATTDTTLIGADSMAFSDSADSNTVKDILVSNIPLSAFNNDSGWTSNSGTVTSVGTANSTFISGSGGPITGSGSLTYSLSATGTPSSSTYLRGDNTWASIPGGYTSWTLAGDSGSSQTITDGNTATFAGGTGISTAASATDTLTITNTGVTSAIGGTGVDVNTSTGAVTFTLDLNELTTSTSDADGDFFAVVDTVGAQKKLTKANINLSGFNNDSGFTTNTGTVTSVQVSGGSTGLSFSGGPITGSGTITASGTLDVDNGGTGQTSYTDGQLLIGNTTGNTLAKSTLTAGSGISITNGAGSITIAATGGGGTVTSVGSGTGLTGGPITGSGTLSVDYVGTDNYILAATTDTTLAGTDSMAFNDAADSNTVKDILVSNIPLSAFNNDSGWTSNTGDITAVTAGTGLSGGGTSGAVTVNLDLNSLSASGTLVGTDDLAVVDGTTTAKTQISTIPLSIFNNDAGWTSNTGDITGVTAGNGLTGGGTSGSVTLTVGAGTGIDVAASSISVDVSDFMTNGANNRVLTATGTDAMNAESALTFSGTELQVSAAARSYRAPVQIFSASTTTALTTAAHAGEYLIKTHNGTHTFTLPSSFSAGDHFTIIYAPQSTVTSGAVTITANTGDNITWYDGSSSVYANSITWTPKAGAAITIIGVAAGLTWVAIGTDQ